jgi:hypothetical protein
MILGTSERAMLDDLAKGVAGVAREGLATSVGLGLLLFQHAQVQRRELMRHSARILHQLGTTIEERLDPDRR